MAKKRYSVRVVGSCDESVLARGDEVVFMGSVRFGRKRVPMGAMGTICETFPRLQIQLHEPWRSDHAEEPLVWPVECDPREVLAKVHVKPDSGWVDFDVAPVPALPAARKDTSRPPPTARSPV